MTMKRFGLIGYPLSHSFSKRYFSDKFQREGLLDCAYDLYPIEDAKDFLDLFAHNPHLKGLNVTIPHKQAVLPYLDKLDPASAARIGAVNVIKKEADGTLVGYNSDYYGFMSSLVKFLGPDLKNIERALILGKGGAALAVQAALADLHIPFTYVSRGQHPNAYAYEDLDAGTIAAHRLVVNTTPLGMYPNITESPNIPYQYLSELHFVYDLVYNPEVTMFMQRAAAAGAKTTNGHQMLILQAEKAWEIWKS